MGGVTVTESSVPVWEEVCVATERRIVGFTDAPSVVEEDTSFSSGVPSAIVPVLDTALYSYPPGYVVVNPPGGDGYVPPDPSEIPLPAAGFLFIGVVAIIYAVRNILRFRRDLELAKFFEHSIRKGL